MSGIQVFDRRDAVYEPFRTAGSGYQSVCEWVGPANGGRYQADIATLTPGQAVFIPEGTKVTMEVPRRLVWTCVAYADSLHWKDTPMKPGAVEEI